MSPDPIAILTMLGLGKYAAGIVALVMCAGYVITWLAPLLTLPTSGGTKLFLYNVVQKIAANVGNAKNAVAPIAMPAVSGDTVAKLGLLLAFGIGLALAACGSSPTVASATVAAGTLFCKDGAQVAALVGVTVTNATADKVATACKLASMSGLLPTGNAVPVPPPEAPTIVAIATVATDVAAAVEASKTH